MKVTPSSILAKLPPYQDKWVTVVGSQDVGDIIADIVKSHYLFAPYYDRFAYCFSAGTIEEICNSLVNFCKDNIEYREENEDIQSTALPTGIIERGHGDCKHYASFIGGCLSAIARETGVPIHWRYCFASYKLDERTPYHVFVTVDTPSGTVWCDPTPGAEGKEPVWVVYKKINESRMSKAAVTGSSVRAIGTVSTASVVNQASTIIAAIPGGQPLAEILSITSSIASLFKGLPLPANQMWLCADYQYWVLGQSNVKSDHNGANASYFPAAMNWFSSVLGVPIFDSTYFAAIRGVDSSSWQPQGLSVAERVANYRATAKGLLTAFSTIASGQVATIQQVYSKVLALPDANIQLACYISDNFQMPYQGNLVAGSWSEVQLNQKDIIGQLFASGAITAQTAVATGGAGVLDPATGGTGIGPTSSMPLILIVAAALGLLLITD